MVLTEEDVSRMERYTEAARELVEMKDDLQECLETLKDLQQFKLPTPEQMSATARHLEELQAIEDLAEA